MPPPHIKMTCPMKTIKVSLPSNTPLALPGGVWEQKENGEWVRVEEPRWHRWGDRIIVDYTEYEAAVVVGMLEDECRY